MWIAIHMGGTRQVHGRHAVAGPLSLRGDKGGGRRYGSLALRKALNTNWLTSQPHLLVPAVTDGFLILGAERTEAAHEDRFLGGDDTVQAGNRRL